MLTIACVLKSGRFERGVYKDGYTPDDVGRLKVMVQDNLSLPHRFVCFSDVDVPCERIPLKHGWSGWWSKIEVFSDVFDGTVIYIDLDTVIAGSIDHFAGHQHQFTMLRDFGAKAIPNSGFMAWAGDYRHIYETFAQDPKPHMRKYIQPPQIGDQAYIASVQKPLDFWQDLFPNQVLSYKKHCVGKERPEDARVVCFHGEPKGAGSSGWVKQIWSNSNGRW